MKKSRILLFVFFLNIQMLLAASVSLQGTVKSSTGSGIADVKVTLAKMAALSATTNAQGAFFISGATSITRLLSSAKTQYQFSLTANAIVITPAFENMKGSIEIFSSSGRKNISIPFIGTRAGKKTVSLPQFVSGLNIIRMTIGNEVITQTLVCLGGSNMYLKNDKTNLPASVNFLLSKSAVAVAVDTLIATKAGYLQVKLPIDSLEKTGIVIVMQEEGVPGIMPLVYDKENTGVDCAKPTTFPAFSALKAVSNLPDPFLMEDGSRISTKAQWECRRAEISAQIQNWGIGPKGAPPSNLTATYSNGKLTVVVTQGGASITLSTTITTPSGAGPFPALIQMDGAGVPASIFTSRGCATMSFTSSQLVPSSMSVTRGAGTYFKMYPDKNTGAMIEWAWGVSRIIDGLYKTADQNKIDLKHLAVSGCSYAGKMALYAGAFDERIALTIPEESGGGGEASWRFMATQTGTEDLEAAQGTAWYAQNLLQFKNKDAPKLPFDEHELVAMIAPRAVLIIGNTAIDRLGSQAGYVSMKAATEVWVALGVPDRIGYSQNNTGTHCAFPSVQTADVAAFVDKFMLGKTASNITKSPYTTDLAKWVTWSTPALK